MNNKSFDPDGLFRFSVQAEDDYSPWYAVRLFTLKTEAVASYLKEHGLEIFIPMEWEDYVDQDNHRRRKLKPVVRNLVFIKKTTDEKNLRKLIIDSQYKMAVMLKSKESRNFYEIPSTQMREFQMMCNPEIAMKKFLSEDEAKLKAGTPVMVTHGPLKGFSGKLVRSSKKYFLLKEVPGMAVMLKVSRWCCKAMEE